VKHAGTKVTVEMIVLEEKPSQGRQRPPRPAGLPDKKHPPVLVFGSQAILPSLYLCAQVFSPELSRIHPGYPCKEG
jgi:hypothetical protein